MDEREWDEVEDVEEVEEETEPSVRDLAEAHLQAELERNHKYLFDARFGMI